MNQIRKLSFQEARDMIETRDDIVVADVREENEFATGHVDDSINLPLTRLIDVPAAQGKAFAAAFIPSLDTPVLVYCRTGQRSILAAKALLSFGYENVYDMGGLSGWPYGLSYD